MRNTSQNIATTLHPYRFDISKPQGRADYAALRERAQKGSRAKAPTWVMHHWQADKSLGRWVDSHKGETIPTEIETKHLFGNQWNTTPIEGLTDKGLRVWAWAEFAWENSDIKSGYYIALPAELLTLLDNTSQCGYCGKQEPAAKGYTFCPHCLDSEYLEQKNLHLLRMMPVSFNGNRKPLTEGELAHLLPLYVEAQLHGTTERGRARIAKQRADIIAGREKALKAANTEADGMLWLMDNGVNVGNVIFYNHTGKFSFGWRQPLSGDVLSGLLDIISEFPFPYEIKCADGKTLSAE